MKCYGGPLIVEVARRETGPLSYGWAKAAYMGLRSVVMGFWVRNGASGHHGAAALVKGGRVSACRAHKSEPITFFVLVFNSAE